MYNISAIDETAIAQKEFEQHIEVQAQKIASLKIPQHRAKYHDKNRVKLADVKGWVFARTGLKCSKQVRSALKKLGIKIDLRLTVSWIYINLRLVYDIAVFQKSAVTTNAFQVGNWVEIVNCPPNLVHILWMSTFRVRENGVASCLLDGVSTAIAIENLQLVS